MAAVSIGAVVTKAMVIMHSNDQLTAVAGCVANSSKEKAEEVVDWMSQMKLKLTFVKMTKKLTKSWRKKTCQAIMMWMTMTQTTNSVLGHLHHHHHLVVKTLQHQPVRRQTNGYCYCVKTK